MYYVTIAQVRILFTPRRLSEQPDTSSYEDRALWRSNAACKNQTYVVLTDFNQTGISRQIFIHGPRIKFHGNPSSSKPRLGIAGGREDVTQRVGAFLTYANVPVKNSKNVVAPLLRSLESGGRGSIRGPAFMTAVLCFIFSPSQQIPR